MSPDRPTIIQILSRCHLFQGIDSAKLEAVANALVPMDAAAGAVIFQQGEDPDVFYFILSGKVKLSHHGANPRFSLPFGFLEEGDYFGQEVLADNWPRQMTVTADTDTAVLRLGVPEFRELINLIPALSPRLQFILDSYRLMLRSRFAWLDPDEYVYYISRKHNLFMLFNLLPPFVAAMFVLPAILLFGLSSILAPLVPILLAGATLLLLAWGALGWVDWSNDYCLITSRRVVYQERILLLYDSRQEAPLEALQSTTTNTSQTGRILRYGNVAIRTFMGVIMFKSVTMPDQVMAIAQEQQLRAQTGARRAEMKKLESLIQKGIEKGSVPLTLQNAGPKPAQAPKLSPFQLFLSDMFHLRYEHNGVIIYRTHWFVLVKKIWLPSLIIFALVFILFARLFNLYDFISTGAVAALVFLFMVGIGSWWSYQYMDWHNDIYLITGEQVIDVYKKPFGSEQRDAAPLKNVLSIEYKRIGLLGLLLNYGTVYIRVGGKELTFDDVYNPSAVQRELFDKLSAKNYAEKQAEQEKEGQRMAEWFAAYNRVVEQRRTPPPPPNPPARSGF